MTTNTTSTASQAPAVSIDTPEFRELAYAFKNSSLGFDFNETIVKLIALINAWGAAQREEGREEGLSQAMQLCDAIGQDHRDAYKGRGKYAPNNPRRADTHADGCSDGAWECEGAIRELLSGERAAPRPPESDSKPNTDCSGDPTSCPDNEGYGCACDPMNKSARAQSHSQATDTSGLPG